MIWTKPEREETKRPRRGLELEIAETAAIMWCLKSAQLLLVTLRWIRGCKYFVVRNAPVGE